ESVPPKMYGGTERIVSYLTEELVRQGHDVTLFASGDSQTSAKLVSGSKEALRLGNCIDPLAPHVTMLQEVLERYHEFDVIHYHIDYLHFPVSKLIRNPQLTTLHGRLNIPELSPLYEKFGEMPVVSISNDQRLPLPLANWTETVYHGLPLDLYELGKGDGDYVAFIGRVSPEKRLDRAIAIAKKAGIKLKIAAKIDKADQEYYEKEIQPLMNDPLVEYVGEIGEKEKVDFLGKAKALLFPIDWSEPFGLVMIESMACGTPVLAWPCGSVNEVVDEEKTGFIVSSIEEAVKALEKIENIDRVACRKQFEKRFSVQRMAADYLNVYKKLIASNKSGSLKSLLLKQVSDVSLYSKM
ncbi:glycosyltransferase family 4 protein, partial [Xanthovirga aplysinae]|uniref:glycosyltransferase family 4 protein n=1 Tax=Xanthovirga aplysinae TaxID=2529853 RepID=UPI0012BD0CD2